MLYGSPHLEWVRPARQARSQETHQRLLDAAEELLAEKGFTEIPVAEVARRAGFSVGAIYARCRDKAGILRSIRERLWEEVCATGDAALDPARWEGATITEIAQDEPLNDAGDGNTCPDGSGIGTDRASLRAERSGQGDGRVYHVGFQADDGVGGMCLGTV